MRLAILLCLVLFHPLVASAGLQLSPNQRYLVDEQGTPFFMVGDTAWALIGQLNLQDAELYLQDRADRGFNLVLVSLIERNFSTNAPANIYGELPFNGAPFVTPNEAYFAHADAILEMARVRGITVLLAPIYLGYACSDQGWCQEVNAASLADMRAWGRFLGQRYASHDNIIWLIGGDYDPTSVANELREVVFGIREFDTVHLMTAHNRPETQAITPWPNETWIDVNNVYSYSSTVYAPMKGAYDVNPILPTFLIEAAYENEHSSTPQQLRAQSHWTALSGGFGHVFGNCPIWLFGYSSTWCGLSNWKNELGNDGSLQMTAFRDLYESRRWFELVPDFNHSVLTSGYGTFGDENYATAARASGGSSILAYLPSPRAITVNTNSLSGTSVRGWWFDPATGAAEVAGTFPKGILNFAAYATNDRVLVLDDAALNLPPPGNVVTATAPLSPNLRVFQNVPNPFNPSTAIHFELTRQAQVTIAIHDMTGRRVRLLLDETRDAGAHAVSWDGRDDQRHSLSSGVYLCKVETPGARLTQKITLLK